VQTGLVTVLVLSGVSQEADLPRYAYRPDYIVKDAAGLILLLKEAPAGGIARGDDPV
jgi:ribonucleotide monophosphatase NagD (HAD superfamily)